MDRRCETQPRLGDDEEFGRHRAKSDDGARHEASLPNKTVLVYCQADKMPMHTLLPFMSFTLCTHVKCQEAVTSDTPQIRIY